MRSPTAVTTLVCSLLLPLVPAPQAIAQPRPEMSGVPSGPGGADAALYRAPALDPFSLVLAYNKLNGTVVDFRPYAERTTAYLNASAFDRQTVLTREITRLEGQYAAFDLSRPFLLRIGTRLRQYDAQRGGYSTGLNPDAYVPLADPVTGKGYALEFRNADDISFAPVGDAQAARNFAQRHGFSTQADTAGDVSLEFVVRLAEAPPAVGSNQTVVRADILAARVLARGQLVWDFGPTVAGRVPAQQVSQGTVPVLKAADVQGIRVGMPVEEGSGIASRTYPTKRWQDGSGGRWFRDINPDAEPPTGTLNREKAVRCGTDPLSLREATLRMQFDGRIGDEPVADVSEACLGYDAEGGRVSRVVSGQRLSGSTADAVRTSLVAKYGPATYSRNGGRVLQWIGRDPLRSDGAPVSLTVRLDSRPAGGIVLAVTAEPYADPNVSKPPIAPTPSAPRL